MIVEGGTGFLYKWTNFFFVYKRTFVWEKVYERTVDFKYSKLSKFLVKMGW